MSTASNQPAGFDVDGPAQRRHGDELTRAALMLAHQEGQWVECMERLTLPTLAEATEQLGPELVARARALLYPAQGCTPAAPAAGHALSAMERDALIYQAAQAKDCTPAQLARAFSITREETLEAILRHRAVAWLDEMATGEKAAGLKGAQQ